MILTIMPSLNVVRFVHKNGYARSCKLRTCIVHHGVHDKILQAQHPTAFHDR